MMENEKVPRVGEEIRSSNEPVRIRTWQEIQRENECKKPIQERIDAMTYVKPFPIKEVDLLTIKRFIKFCRFSSKNDWGVGLKILLDSIDYDAKTMMLYEKISALESRIEGLESSQQEPTREVETNEDKPKKTFGGMKNE